MKITLQVITIYLLSILALTAGSRSLSAIGITNATHGEETATSKRLYELLKTDAKTIFIQSQTFGFNWQPGVKLTEIPNTKTTFAPLITPSNKKSIISIIETYKTTDGLIVYQYDQKQKVARLKLFDYDGSERILIKIPLESGGPMKGSILRVTRRAAMVAIGGSIPFSP